MSIWSRLLQHIHEWVFKMLFWPIHALGHSWMVLLDLCALLLSVWSCVRSHVYVIHLWQPKIASLQNVGNICHGNLQVGYTFKPSPTRYTKNNVAPLGRDLFSFNTCSAACHLALMACQASCLISNESRTKLAERAVGWIQSWWLLS